jgi:NAD(P)-dependent dehydrogenase (short-subunit alcohol dehydrogenase family)
MVAAMANILITGTSSGFGKLTTQALAGKGHTVVATLRDVAGKNKDAAAELRKVDRCTVVELDVTSDKSVDAGVAAAIKEVGHLDVVVNNAGYAVGGLVETVTAAQMLAEYDTNVIGVHRVNRAVLPHLRERRSGLLVHISSGLGRRPLPLLGVYSSTKWAIECYAEVLRYELKATGVDSVIVQPGAFPTEFNAKSMAGADQARAAGYGPLAHGLEMMGARMQQMFAVPNPPHPQEVADVIVGLVDMPAGKRPPRTVVDPTRKLNDANAEVMRAVLNAMGMSAIAD